MDHAADDNFSLDSRRRKPGSALSSDGQRAVLVDAKELGHLCLAARGGEEGYTTCTSDDVHLGENLSSTQSLSMLG